MEAVPPGQPNNHRLPEAAAAVDVSELQKLSKCSGTGGGTSKVLPAAAAEVAKVVKDQDETECSSSFADTISSRNDNSSSAQFSDAEVESQFHGGANSFASAFGGFDNVLPMRKKRLTSHWREFIRPLMWRCKWTELRIKQFESQALKYTKDIAALNRRKHSASEQFIQEVHGSRSLPFTRQSRCSKVMKRRKRKRVEEITDTKLYMSQHVLFSCLENKKSDQDATAMTDDFGNPVVVTEKVTTSHEDLDVNDRSFLKDDDDNSIENILRKIDTVQSRVHKMKAQLDLVMSQNAGKFSSSENLSNLVPFDVQTNSVRSPTFSTCNGDAVSVGGLYAPVLNISEYDTGDFMMPGSAVSSYGEAFHVPDIIESTLGHLSSAEVTQHQSQIGDSAENIVDNILAHNQTAEAEVHTFIKTENLPEVKQEPEKSGEEESTNPAAESDSGTKAAVSTEQSTLNLCLTSGFQFPKNKRKRGERKAATGPWNRQRPGEPDSQ